MVTLSGRAFAPEEGQWLYNCQMHHSILRSPWRRWITPGAENLARILLKEAGGSCVSLDRNPVGIPVSLHGAAFGAIYCSERRQQAYGVGPTR